MRPSRSSDIARQVVVISAFCFMIVGDMVGIGAFGGTPIQDAVGGAFDPDASYLTPATGAFSIWSVIYLGLLGYTVWQALPGQRARERQRAVGWWIALTMVLNGAWLATVQLGTVWATFVVLVLLVAALCAAYVRVVRTYEQGQGVLDSALVDGTTGLHLGWASLATVANLGAALTTVAPASWESAADVVGVLVIAVVVVITLALSRWAGWRVAPSLAVAWGLAWLAVARLDSGLRSTPIAVAAIVGAVVVVLVPVARRLTGSARTGD